MSGARFDPLSLFNFLLHACDIQEISIAVHPLFHCFSPLFNSLQADYVFQLVVIFLHIDGCY